MDQRQRLKGNDMRILTYVIMLLFFAVTPVFAQENNPAFEALIRKHYDGVAELYNVAKIDNQAIIKFTDAYTDSAAYFKVSVTSNVSEMVIDEQLAKKDFLASLSDTSKELYNSTAEYTIIDIAYDENNTEAAVHFTFRLRGTGRMVMKDVGVVDIGLDSLSECTEKFRLDGDVIKGIDSDCRIEAIYQKPVPVK